MKPRHVPAGRGELILVVDDHREVRVMLGEMIRGLGYQVLEAGRLEEAETLLRDHPVALLLTDIMLAGEPLGLRLARTSRSVRPGVPVALMSGSPERVDVVLDGEVCQALLMKPYRREHLALTLRRLLDAAGDGGRS